jgi:hypothetical protein
MHASVENEFVETACRNLQGHTLSQIPGLFAQLIYLASTRDYLSGVYHHDGLEYEYGPEVTGEALKRCHTELFSKLLTLPLSELVDELDAYLKSSGTDFAHSLLLWDKLQIYRVTPPLDCSRVAAELFLSNVKIALAILYSRARSQRPDQQFALQFR